MMKQGLARIVVATLAAGIVMLAWTPITMPAAADSHCTDCDDDCSGGSRELRYGQMLLPPGAYLKVNETSEELWREMGELQEQLHVAIWEFSVLQSDWEAGGDISADIDEIRGLIGRMRRLQSDLREHIVYPEGRFRGMREGGQGGGGGRSNVN